MKSQKPANGIMLTNEWKDAKTFHIECECTDPDHAAVMWIEVDREKDFDAVNVSFYVNTSNPFWEKGYNRVRAAWDILVKGVHQQEHHMILHRQAALNMADAIRRTVKELDKA